MKMAGRQRFAGASLVTAPLMRGARRLAPSTRSRDNLPTDY